MSASLVCVVVAAVIAVRLEPVVQGWTRQALVAVDRRLPSGFDRYRRATAIVSTAAE
jgi:hypothetical protein